MFRQGTGIIYCFLSRCCNSKVTYGKAIEYNTADLTYLLAPLPTTLAPALLQAGVEERHGRTPHLFEGVKTVCPPFYTNSGPGKRAHRDNKDVKSSLLLHRLKLVMPDAVITADYYFMHIRGY